MYRLFYFAHKHTRISKNWVSLYILSRKSYDTWGKANTVLKFYQNNLKLGIDVATTQEITMNL